MKFLCLAYGDERSWNRLSEKEQDELLSHDEVIRKRGDLVSALQPDAMVVKAWDGSPHTSKGSFASSERPLVGFSVIEAHDTDEVVRLVKDTPCARAGGAIEIRPILEINDLRAAA